MSRGTWYGGAVISGTKRQYRKILSKFHHYEKDDGNISLQEGVFRIRKRCLIIEQMGWGGEMEYFEDTVRYAKKIGCNAQWYIIDTADYPEYTQENLSEYFNHSKDWLTRFETTEVKRPDGFVFKTINMKTEYLFDAPSDENDNWDLTPKHKRNHTPESFRIIRRILFKEKLLGIFRTKKTNEDKQSYNEDLPF